MLAPWTDAVMGANADGREHQLTEDADSWDEGDAPSDDRRVYVFFCCFDT